MNTLKVLVMEDQEMDFDLLVVQLQTAGLKVHATRAESALELHQACARKCRTCP